MDDFDRLTREYQLEFSKRWIEGMWKDRHISQGFRDETRRQICRAKEVRDELKGFQLYSLRFESAELAEDFTNYHRGSEQFPGPDLSTLDHEELLRLQHEFFAVLRQEERDREEIEHGYIYGHYSEEHIRRYGSPS